MKRVAAAILILLYAGTSIGATVHTHYCMGKLKSMDLKHYQNQFCKFCGMDIGGNDGCCKDEYKKIQVGKDHKASENNYELNKIPSPPVFLNLLSGFDSYEPVIEKVYHSVNAPPDPTGEPVFISNCVFRI